MLLHPSNEENGMRVVLYGATGMIGTRVLKELLSRGHTVTAVVRDPSKLAAQKGLTIDKGDMLDADHIAKVAKGSDVVISSYGPPTGTRSGEGESVGGGRALPDCRRAACRCAPHHHGGWRWKPGSFAGAADCRRADVSRSLRADG